MPYDSADIPVSALPAHILAVDDEGPIVEEIIESLVSQSVLAEGVSMPREALALLSADPSITVLLTDVNMPEMTGLELAEQALLGRTDENALEVVVLTGHATVDLAIDALRVGVFDFVRKPVRLAALKAALDRAHHRAATRRFRYKAGQASHYERPPVETHSDRGVERADDEEGNFLSLISHELRTPLNPIIGFSQLIEDRSGSLGEAELKEYARYIREAGQSLFGLTESVLKLTELKSGSPKVNRAWEDSADLLNRLAEMGCRTAREKEQTITVTCGSAAEVFTDRDLILQALHHLLKNAIVFSPAGSSIELSAAIQGGEVAFSIADNGPGMSPSQMAEAIKPFRQLDMKHNRLHSGLGLGLSLASLMATALGGRLEITAAPGGGTVASVVHPVGK